MLQRLAFILSILFIYSLNLSAQVQPYSFNRASLQQNVPVEIMPKVDAVQLLKEDALNNNKELPYRFGYTHTVNLDMNQSGLKQTLKDGSILWRIGIKCPNAYSINLIFSKFNIPDGSQLYIYSKDHSYIIGPYATRDNNKYHRLGTGICKGEEIVVEYYEPFYAAFHGTLTISGVTHAYKDPFRVAKSFGQSGSCNTNIICPAASAWQDDKRAVAMIIVNGNSFCSGAMLGNATLDGTPYFLTAFHCYDTTVANWVFMFNYESATCTPSQDGPMNMTVSGAQLISLNSKSDFCLLELLSVPDPLYQVYYAGWSNVNTSATSEAGIHHPSGDVKKISFANSRDSSDGWVSNDGTHWNVNWDSGDTESGSSGSPLFDQDHHVVGQLHGGTSACGGNNMHDLFGKFAISWNGATAQQRLKDWLDPQNTGATNIHGYYPNQPSDTINAKLVLINSPVNNYCTEDTVTPVINVKNIGQRTITSLLIKYNIDGGNDIVYNWTGSITTFENRNISLPGFAAGIGGHIFFASINNPNNKTDQDLSDNSLSGGFNVIAGSNVIVEIKTDDFPGETSYNLINSSGDTVLNGKDFMYAETVNKNKLCLRPGCYTFKIYDAGGDGICCSFSNGYYKVYTSTGDTLATGGQFDSVDTKYFCLYSNGIIDLSHDAGINIYPNPTNGTVKLEWVKHFDQIDIQVYNSIGQQVRKEAYFDTDNGTINLQHLSSGVYLFKIIIGDEVLIKKVSFLNTP